MWDTVAQNRIMSAIEKIPKMIYYGAFELFMMGIAGSFEHQLKKYLKENACLPPTARID